MAAHFLGKYGRLAADPLKSPELQLPTTLGDYMDYIHHKFWSSALILNLAAVKQMGPLYLKDIIKL